MGELKWERGATPTDMFNRLEKKLKSKKLALLTLLATRYAPQAEAWMKMNRPWQDRTSHARQTLHTWVETGSGRVILWLAHGVEYGVNLEYNFAGRYAIIAPTIDLFAPLILDDVRAVLRGP